MAGRVPRPPAPYVRIRNYRRTHRWMGGRDVKNLGFPEKTRNYECAGTRRSVIIDRVRSALVLQSVRNVLEKRNDSRQNRLRPSLANGKTRLRGLRRATYVEKNQIRATTELATRNPISFTRKHTNNLSSVSVRKKSYRLSTLDCLPVR